MLKVISFTLVLCVFFPKLAYSSDTFTFENAQQKALFNSLIYELRCPKCQSINIADSNAPIAKDMKQVVYEKVLKGESEIAIKHYFQSSYGDFVLYDPPMRLDTIWIWLIPAVFFLGSALIVFYLFYKKQSVIIDDRY